MTLQVLISTMYEIDYSLLDKMHVNSDAVVVNQCYEDGIHTFFFNNHQIIWVNSTERGLSKSRNLGLKHVNSEIVLLADNDEIFVDNYEELILSSFKKIGKADLITYNINSIDNIRKRYFNKSIKQLNFSNIFRYGSARIAFKNQFIKKNNINFDERFGAGTLNGGGEDSLFLNNFLKKHGKCYSHPTTIAIIDDSKSTWFKGFDKQYFINLGKFIYALNKKNYKLNIFLYALKRKKATKTIGFKNALNCLYEGAKLFKEEN